MPQNDFTPDEFRMRRRRLCEAIGKDGVALVPGAKAPAAHLGFRQFNDFYYLCGIETPGAYLLIGGADEKAAVFLPRESQLDRQSDETLLSADNAEHVSQVTGVDQALGLERLGERLARAKTVFTPFEDGQGRAVSRHQARALTHQSCVDPWDLRPTRSACLVETLRRRFPGLEVRDLSGMLDELRLVKSPAEVALLRRAGRLTAAGLREAIRATRPGVMEYQLDAILRYQYIAGGAADHGYQAILAGGANTWYGHYGLINCPLNDGDWVLGDCAPDYHYYTSDIGRMWPVNGRYSPLQRSLYGFVVEYHKVLLGCIRPGRMVADIHQEAAEKMKPVADGWEFHSPEHEAAARAMFDFRGHVSHCVGMSVHDGGLHYSRPLETGMVFSVDPQMWIRPEKVYVRVEDTLAVTEDGIENFTQDAPLELDDVEALMRQDGMLQAFPPA